MSTNVTVIVPTFNRAQYLPACIESLIAQTNRAERIIVVDDGSTDETQAVLAGYGDRIEVVRQENGGKSSALNRALPLVDSAYVWIFDDDDVACPDAIGHHLKALNGGENRGFSYSSYQRATTNADGSLSPGPIRHAERFEGRALFATLLEENLLPQPSILVRTACYQALGPFDERLVRSQDYEMLLRLSRRYAAISVPEVTYYYRQHGGARGSQTDSFASNSLNEKWVKYDQIIFGELHRDLALWEYLPEIGGECPLSESEQRHALIRRFSVMMRYCLWELALDDLDSLLKRPSDSPVLETAEQQSLHRIFENRASLMFRSGYDGRRLRAQLGKGDRRLSANLRLEIARSLYYELRRGLSAGNRREALAMAARLIPLLGARTLADAIHAKVRPVTGLWPARPGRRKESGKQLRVTPAFPVKESRLKIKWHGLSRL